jgi:hypothetical protein
VGVCACVLTVAAFSLAASEVFSESVSTAVGSVLLVVVAGLVAGAATAPVWRSCALLAIAALMAMSAPGLTLIGVARDWVHEDRILVDTGYRSDAIARAAQSAREFYAVPPALQSAIAGRPVGVDNFDTTVVWAYGFVWRPAPVFQQYSAYTSYLDELNAKSIATAPDDQLILRAPVSLNERNPVWDPPRYVLTELCDYRVAGEDARWLLLRKAADRCSSPMTLGVTSVAAGQAVRVPSALAGQMVLMSFVPARPSLLDRAARLVYKPRHVLSVHAPGPTVGNGDFQLPRALASGPLIVRFPAAAGWPAIFGGADSYDQVSFSESGTVTFRVVSLH